MDVKQFFNKSDKKADSVDQAKEDIQDTELKKKNYIQKIIGIKSNETSNDSNIIYYIKWAGLSYIHNCYLKKEQILNISGGKEALDSFNMKLNQGCILIQPSFSVEDLLILDDQPFLQSYFKVDRIIGKRIYQYDQNDHNDFPNLSDFTNIPTFLYQKNENDKKIQYFTKWGSQNYDECTWEFIDDIPDGELFIRKYEERHSEGRYVNSTKIDENRRNVSPESFKIIEKPPIKMRKYQIEGFNWLRNSWFNGKNTLLFDEEGLDKAKQVVAALFDIYSNHGIHEPFIVVAECSSLQSWKDKIENLTCMNAVVYEGNEKSLEIVRKYEIFDTENENENENRFNHVCFDILITSYETFVNESAFLSSIEWHYLVLDDGNRLQNHNDQCYQLLMNLKFEQCTILDGCPIPNDIERIWSLLHFIDRETFNDLNSFQIECSDIMRLRMTLMSYLMRRMKDLIEPEIKGGSETVIEVELTDVQLEYYKQFLMDNNETLVSEITESSLPSLMNLFMKLKKVANHPYLIRDAKDKIKNNISQKLGKPLTENEVLLESIVKSSGKMIFIDKFLSVLREKHEKVIILSNTNPIFNILEDYFLLVGIKFERIDGNVTQSSRTKALKNFSNDQDTLALFLNARSTGIGISLDVASTVIIFDSDMNPQNNIQALMRCFQIGKKFEFKVFRLVTRTSYEIEMIKYGMKNLQNKFVDVPSNQINAIDLERIIRGGVTGILDNDDENEKYCEESIDQILERRSKPFSSYLNDDCESKDLIDAKDFWLQIFQKIKSND